MNDSSEEKECFLTSRPFVNVFATLVVGVILGFFAGGLLLKIPECPTCEAPAVTSSEDVASASEVIARFNASSDVYGRLKQIRETCSPISEQDCVASKDVAWTTLDATRRELKAKCFTKPRLLKFVSPEAYCRSQGLEFEVEIMGVGIVCVEKSPLPLKQGETSTAPAVSPVVESVTLALGAKEDRTCIMSKETSWFQQNDPDKKMKALVFTPPTGMKFDFPQKLCRDWNMTLVALFDNGVIECTSEELFGK